MEISVFVDKLHTEAEFFFHEQVNKSNRWPDPKSDAEWLGQFFSWYVLRNDSQVKPGSINTK